MPHIFLDMNIMKDFLDETDKKIDRIKIQIKEGTKRLIAGLFSGKKSKTKSSSSEK